MRVMLAVQIKSRCTDAVPNVAKAAATAVKVISWKP